jgi:transcriptional regulator with XRE-family HTH domain
MNFKIVREKRGWTQQGAARRLGVSQALVSQWERGNRRPSRRLLRKLQKLGVDVDATALPFQKSVTPGSVDFVQELASLGYPGFAHVKAGTALWNPAQVLVLALSEDMLDRRVAEGLPWLVLQYCEMDWKRVCREAKLHDLQNRLGLTVSLARELAEKKQDAHVVHRLSGVEQELRRSMLARQNTYCNESMTSAERNWLREHRSAQAARWNVLSDLATEHLSYVE